MRALSTLAQCVVLIRATLLNIRFAAERLCSNRISVSSTVINPQIYTIALRKYIHRSRDNELSLRHHALRCSCNYLYGKIYVMLGNAERHRLCARLVIISWIHCTEMLVRDIDLWSICVERAHFADIQYFLACQVEVTKAKLVTCWRRV
jgi:hypothetical protein